MDENQGKARHSRGNRTIVDAFRSEYHAPQPWEHEATGTPFSEQDLIDYHKWQEDCLRERQGESLDYPN